MTRFGSILGSRCAQAWILAGAAASAAGSGRAFSLPANFHEIVAFQGLNRPTAVRFSPDGRVFVAEKSGVVQAFDGLSDATPTLLIDVRTNVHDFWDRGLLGFAMDPDFPSAPYLYLLYTYDYDPLDPAHPAPRYGDVCPDRDASNQIIGPGAMVDGCVVNGRLSRFRVNPNNTLDGGEHVLLENRWCQQFPSHSLGSLLFGPEGALYVTAGDGGAFSTEDWGQLGGTRTGIALPTPANPCADLDTLRGTPTTKPDATGGSLRAQSPRTLNDPGSFDGSVLRIDPDTGAAWPTNPLVGGPRSTDDAIIAYGLRNPFRATRRPGTSEIWIADVGWNTWEEIDRLPDPEDAILENFGWPCLEGSSRLPGFNGTPPTDLELCASLETSATTPAYFQYQHGQPVYAGDPCLAAAGSALSGLAFYTGGTYPAAYDGALFFADHSRNCVWVMTAGVNGDPDVGTRTVFLTSAAVSGQQIGNPRPVELTIGPGGDLFLVDYEGGRIRRITYDPPSGEAGALQIARLPAGQVSLSWAASCMPSDADYEVYEGTLGQFATHTPRTCTTSGSLSYVLTPHPAPAGSGSYFLVSPTNSVNEGSLGSDSFDVERPQGPAPCRPRLTADCP